MRHPSSCISTLLLRSARSCSHRQRNAHDSSGPLSATGEMRVAAMSLRNLAYDGEPETASFDAGAQHAVKSLERAFALADRDAGPVVLHAQDNIVRVRSDAHGYLAAGLRITYRVIEQVVQHLLQQEGVAFDTRSRKAAVEAEVDVASQCPRHPFGCGIARKLGKGQLLGGARTLGCRLRARK